MRRICGGSFLELSEEEKHQVRIKYTEYINGLNDEVIVSDGHYSFMETVAFTEADGELYDIFIYLYCSPENLKERYALSEKNGKFAGESIESLRQWQEFEINNLREKCHRRNKDFYVVSDNEEEQNKFFDFLSLLREGFSSYDLATDICNQIMEQFNKQDILYMVDGDKTIIIQDSYRFCCNGKSNSGISGSRLAAAHVRLGEKIGRHIAAVFPEKNTSILVLERGGRFFGDGVYMGAGGIFYSMNPKQDDAPVINTERVVIVDSVINTGKSIMRIIDELKNHNPGIDVIIAANVIQNEAVELFKDSFVGVNQSKQTGKTGPDTADRLFNLIKKRY